MFQAGMVNENYDVRPYEVGSKLFKSKIYRQELFFSYGVIDLCLIQGVICIENFMGYLVNSLT